MEKPYHIRQLNKDDAAVFKSIRHAGLVSDPGAFSSTIEIEQSFSVEDYAARLENNTVFAVFTPDGSLAAVAGFRQMGGNSAHRGEVWGVYVSPDHRGKGLGRQMMEALLEYARARVEIVELAANNSNAASVALYRSLGFKSQGVFIRAVKVGEDYFDEEQFALHF